MADTGPSYDKAFGGRSKLDPFGLFTSDKFNKKAMSLTEGVWDRLTKKEKEAYIKQIADVFMTQEMARGIRNGQYKYTRPGLGPRWKPASDAPATIGETGGIDVEDFGY